MACIFKQLHMLFQLCMYIGVSQFRVFLSNKGTKSTKVELV